MQKRKRRGGNFKQLKDRIAERGKLSSQRLRRFRDQRLAGFLQHARKSDFWEAVFNGVKPDKSHFAPEDIKQLPVISKQEIRNNIGNILIASSDKGKLVRKTTSGTTGSGLQFYATKQSEQERHAVWWRFRNHHGIDMDECCGVFSGNPIVPARQKTAPFWRVNFFERQILFSSFHLNKGNIRDYVRYLNKKKLRWLHGYPSVLALMASLIKSANTALNYKPAWITTSSESLLDHQREVIQQVLGAEPIDMYGQAEGVANISQCTYGNYHVDEDFSYVEFLPTRKKDEYKIVGTNFNNKVFPLLRYDTGDIAIIKESRCNCSKPGRVVNEIKGREEDYLVLKDGTKIGRLDHLFKDLGWVREAQLIQEEKGKVRIKINASSRYSSEDEKKIEKAIRDRMGGRIDYQFEYVDHIEKSESGKFQFVVSHLN